MLVRLMLATPVSNRAASKSVELPSRATGAELPNRATELCHRRVIYSSRMSSICPRRVLCVQPQCHLSSEREAVFPLNTQLVIARNIKASSSEQYSSFYFTSFQTKPSVAYDSHLKQVYLSE